MGVLAFIAAESRELSGLLAHGSELRRITGGLDFGRRFQINGRAAVAVANGPGPALAGRALQAVKDQFDLDAIVSLGYCGGLDGALSPSDIVIATSVNGFASSRPATAKSYVPGGIFSSDRVVVTAAEKQHLRATGAIAVDMEAAALVERASAWNVPFYCVRVVTDTADESLPLDFNLCRASDGRFSRSRIMIAALRRPGVLFPELVKLDRRCRSASEALGEFIADCRF